MPRDSDKTIQDDLEARLESWRERLLDLGNRNPLINCRFSERSSFIEFDTPSTETIWRTLAVASEAGATAMRFPLRRDLVPPPDDWQEFDDELETASEKNGIAPSNNDISKTNDASEANFSFIRRKRREWNPPLDECRRSPRLTPLDLLVNRTDTALDRKLRKLSGDAQLSMSEQGVHSLYAAFGFLKWHESVDSGELRTSPLMLIPVSLSRETTSAPWELTEAEDDALDNLCLRQRLLQDFKLELPPLPEISELEEPGARENFLQAIRAAVSNNDRWEVEDRCAIGRFAFPKIAMWRDLGHHRHAVMGNTHCRILGGGDGDFGNEPFGPIDDVPTSRELDDVLSPGEVKTILDCDSSQLEAIAAARKGVSFVLDGPPGTGKSQTIANIIADALSVGRKVLFVSEKIAALEVVKKRLEDRGLGDFCLECHSSKANRRAVLFEMERCLDLPAEVYKDGRPKLNELKEQREQLNQYTRELHKPRAPLGFSPFELFGRISHLKASGAASRTRCVIPKSARTNRANFDQLLRLLQRAGDFAGLLKNYENHPWRGCHRTTRSLSLHDDIKHHLGILATRTSEMATRFGPIEENSLLQPVSLSTLEARMRQCQQALLTPELPVTWLRDPAKTSAAIVQQIESEASASRLRDVLTAFRNPEEPGFPIAAMRGLVEGEKEVARVAKQLNLELQLPTKLRERKESIERHKDRIGPCCALAESLVDSLHSWISETNLQLSQKSSWRDLAALGESIKCAADIGPGQKSWFDTATQANALELVGKAIDIAAKNEKLAKQLSTLIDAEQILPLADELCKAEGLENHIEQVVSLGIKNFADLEQAESSLLETVASLSELQISRQQISTTLNLQSEQWGFPAESTTISELVEQFQNTNLVLGGFKSADDRAIIRKVCEEAMTDLTDAEAIRSSLSDRMSHRAFRDTSVPIASKGTSYTSLWKRWFGGYAKYRAEVADFYNGEVPKGSDLLDDVVMLDRYHRRRCDVQTAAAHWSDRLPEDFDAVETADWKRVSESLDAMENLHRAWPSLMDCLPDKARTIEPEPLALATQTFLDRARKIADMRSSSHNPLLLNADGDTAQQHSQLQQRHSSVSSVANAWRTCQQSMTRSLQSPQELASLLRALAIYRRRANKLIDGSQRYSKWFPRTLEATKKESWLAMRTGIEAARRFTSLGLNPENLASIWCGDCFDDQRSLWASSGDDLQRLQKELQSAFLNVNADAHEQSLGEISRALSGLTASFNGQIQQIEAIAVRVQPDPDLELHELDLHADHITKFQHHQNESKSASAILKNFGIESVEPEDVKAAQWLAQAAAGNRLSNLAKGVATDSEVRSRVQTIINDGKQLFDDDFYAAVHFLKSLFNFDETISGNTTINSLTLDGIAGLCQSWIDQIHCFDEWVAFAGWQKNVVEVGMTTVIDELIRGQYKAEQTTDIVAMQVYRELFDELAESDRHFGEFDIDQHERVRERFRQLDHWEVQAAATQIRQYQLGRSDRPSSSFVGADSSELGILQKEIAKKRKHKPLRRLFSEIPTVLQRLKPCVMMSPLSVSTFLDCDEVRFDLVIFDEASQVFPWDALGAIYRGTQLIVAGDEKQLPPTNFFSRQDAETDDDEDDIGDYESILSLCKSVGMPNKRLKWHYRSKREPLIAFSNHHFYGGELVTFPSVDDGDGVGFEHVPEGRWIDRKNLPEAQRVVQMIVDHVRTRPRKSLGVIALNSTHQRAIEDTLYDLRRERPDIDALFHGGNSFGTIEEELFIKNLENVQGDERDFIFLSLGYGFNNVGKFNKNFGPINKQHGERRLNVAITRARESLTFVASVRSSDMDLSGSKSEGAHLLKSYLSYAERGVDVLDLAMQEIAGETDSPFEEEVATALIRRGLEPVSQVGCGGFRIDLALKHPDRPGQFCLAIECDGATYHSSHTARDRDRIRQAILENLGWTMVRIWSTDWVRNPDRQIQRVLEAYEQAILVPESSTSHSDPSKNGTMDEDLEPTFIKKQSNLQKPSKLSFDSIDDVPDETIHLAATYLLTQAGAMSIDDLIRQTSRELGFRRTGQKIRSRIESRLRLDLESGQIKRSGQKVVIGSPVQ